MNGSPWVPHLNFFGDMLEKHLFNRTTYHWLKTNSHFSFSSGKGIDLQVIKWIFKSSHIAQVPIITKVIYETFRHTL